MAAATGTELYSSFKTYLMQGTGSGTLTYSKLCDINNMPQIGSAPEFIDMTSLSDPIKKGVPGIQSNDSLEFEVSYNPTVYSTIKALDDGTAKHLAIYFGATESGGVYTPSGDDGKFTFDGYVSTPYINSVGVNEGRKMTVTITPCSPFVFSAAT